jgi:ribosomal protein S27AE
MCADALKGRFPTTAFHHVRAHVGFPKDTVDDSVEDTLRGRSFMFFALAALAADAIGGDVTIHVPENGLISLNVPLDPLRVGALSTRTTHPFYMARVNELFATLGLRSSLLNPYRFQTKGAMAKRCADTSFLAVHAKNTMSCSSPGKTRFAKDESQRQPKHCGYCVPCLIRRAALLEGCGEDSTPYQLADLHAQTIRTDRAEGSHIRSFQLAISRLRSHPARARLDIHRPGPLNDYPGDLDAYHDVYVEGLEEVAKLLEGVQAEPS